MIPLRNYTFKNLQAEDLTENSLNSRGTEIFPFSYFENPWLEYDKVIKDIKNANSFHKTRT